MQQYSDHMYYTGTTNPVIGVFVQVNLAGTATKATLYDSGSVEIANPVKTDGTGLFSFYVADGSYDLLYEGAVVTTITSTGTPTGISEAPIDGQQYARKNAGWVAVTTGGGTWGSITGTLSNQTDLQNALNGKSDTSHTHTGVYEPANSNIQNHISSTSNPHSVTKAQVGLTNVTDNAQAVAGAVTSSLLTISTDKRLLGRDNSTAGAQAIEEISLGTGLSLDGSNVLNVTGGVGFVPYGTETSITDTANLAFNSFNIVTVTAADKTLTMPQIASSADYGKMVEIYIAPTTTKLITIDGYGTGSGNYIDGAASRIMHAGESCRLVASSIGWLKQAGKSIPMYCELYNSAAQTGIIKETNTKLTLNSLTTATPAYMDDKSNSNVKIARDGKYGVWAVVQYNGNTKGCDAMIFIQRYRSSTWSVAVGGVYNTITTFASMTSSGYFDAIKDDLIAAYTYHTDTVNVSTLNSPNPVTIKIVEIPSW